MLDDEKLKDNNSSSDIDSALKDYEKHGHDTSSEVSDEVNVKVIRVAEEVATEILSTDDDPTLPVFTFRTIFLGIGLSAFASVTASVML